MITQNTIGVLQSATNWRYGSGGWGKLVDSVVVDNGTDIKSDKDSRLTRVGSGTTVNGPMPVSARAGSPVSTESAWILAQHGVRTNSNTAGQIDGWNVD